MVQEKPYAKLAIQDTIVHNQDYVRFVLSVVQLVLFSIILASTELTAMLVLLLLP